MKLFYSPGACSLSPHIVLREAGLKFDLEQVDLGTKKTKSGGDYLKVNPKGSVPALEIDGGQVLSEGAAIVQYIADKAPASKLAPAAGTPERYRLMEWLNYIATELHGGFGPLFNPKIPADWKAISIQALGKRFDFISNALKGKSYLMGEVFTVADAYLFTILGWTKYMDIDLGQWPVLKAYCERVAARPAVAAALKAEGLVK
ncbi:MAG: glutathione transferase GstA [Alphaproteobacteria bacterium]